MAEPQPSKLAMPVRSRSPAPVRPAAWDRLPTRNPLWRTMSPASRVCAHRRRARPEHSQLPEFRMSGWPCRSQDPPDGATRGRSRAVTGPSPSLNQSQPGARPGQGEDSDQPDRARGEIGAIAHPVGRGGYPTRIPRAPDLSGSAAVREPRNIRPPALRLLTPHTARSVANPRSEFSESATLPQRIRDFTSADPRLSASKSFSGA